MSDITYDCPYCRALLKEGTETCTVCGSKMNIAVLVCSHPGSILSPMLSNIFLHYVLDVWFEETVKPHTDGYCELIRYADYFICVVRYVEDARRIEEALKNRFNKYGLEIHPVKSRVISFGRYEKENADKLIFWDSRISVRNQYAGSSRLVGRPAVRNSRANARK